MSRKSKTKAKVTAKVTKPLTDEQKIKLAEPIMPDIMQAMDMAEAVGKIQGKIEGTIRGRVEGYEKGITAPRNFGEFTAQQKSKAIDGVLMLVKQELLKAYTKFGVQQTSPHESYAVLLEETDELWDEIKADRGRMASARKEATQVAAMAVRYLVDINPR